MDAFLTNFRNNTYTFQNLLNWGVLGGTNSCIPAQVFADFTTNNSVCINTALNFNVTIPAPANTANFATGFSWTFTGNPTITGANTPSPTATWPNVGTYNVTCTATNGTTTVSTTQTVAVMACGINPNYIHNAQWYFGMTASLDFTQGGSTPVVNTAARTHNPPTIFAGETTTSYSDNNGNLLFYTNGVDFWNANHNQINTNGPIFNDDYFINDALPPFTAHFSSSAIQGLLTIPHPNPNLPNHYLIFSAPNALNSNVSGNKVRYVDLDLSTNTFGAINTLTNGNNLTVCEGIILIPHCNGKDYWLLSGEVPTPAGTNRLNVYLVNEYGVSHNPTYFEMNTTNNGFNQYAKPFIIKASPNNDLVAYQEWEIIPSSLPQFRIVSLQFNNSTGVLSNKVSLFNTPIQNGVFSFNSTGDRLFYATSLNIGYHDFNTNTQTTILPSSGGILTTSHGLQLAPDNNIYSNSADLNQMARIINTNTSTPTYETNTVPLNVMPGINSIISIPNYIDGIKPPLTPLTMTITYNTCMQISLSLPSCWEGYDYDINWGDGNSQQTLTVPTNLTHTYATIGSYTVVVTLLPPSTTTIPANPIQLTQIVNFQNGTTSIQGDNTPCLATTLPQQYFVPTYPNATYTWSITNGSIVSGQGTNQITVNWNSVGAGSISVSIASGGCTYTATMPISILANPIITITNPSICVPTNLTASPTGLASYVWTGNNNGTGNPFTANSAGVYIVNATDANGCLGAASINVLPSNQPIITASATNSTICLGSSSTLSASGAGPYTWSPTIPVNGIVSPTATTTYTVTSTNAQGCVSSATKTITVINPPTITITATNNVICIGSSTTLTVSGASSYVWSPTIPTNGVVSPVVTTTYTVTGTNAQGCIGASTKTITVSPLPTITANATNSTICVGSNTTLSATGGSTYVWSPTVPPNGVVSPSATTIYTVTGTSGNGCTNTATKTITVIPQITVTASAQPSIICLGSSTTLSATGATTYVWSPAVPTNGVVSPSVTTTYTVTGTTAGCATATSTVTITVNNNPSSITCCNPNALTDIHAKVFSGNTTASQVLAWWNAYTGFNGSSVNFAANYLTNNTPLDKIYIDGNLTIDQNISFESSQMNSTGGVFMAPNTEVIVNGFTMNIQECAFQSACATMWKGMRTTATNSLITINYGSEISNMKEGIVVNGSLGKLKLESSKFDDNYISIQMTNLPPSYIYGGGYIKNCTFKTQSPTLLAPYSTQTRGEHGIKITNCPRVTIGGTTGERNYFENLYNGIYILQTATSLSANQINTSYNQFKNIGGGSAMWGIQKISLPPNPPITFNTQYRGCAIWGNNTTGQNVQKLYHKGNNNPALNAEDFLDCQKAIIMNGFTAEISTNYATNVDAGFLNYACEKRIQKVYNNNIKNTYLGILMSGNSQFNQIAGNVIKVIGLPNQVYPSNNNAFPIFWSKGIERTGVVLPAGSTISSLSNNTITSAEADWIIGINLNNSKNSAVNTNTINFTSTSSATNTFPYSTLKGIALSGSTFCELKDNTISGKYSNAQNRKSAGVYLSGNSNDNKIACNTFNNLEEAFYVVGKNKALNPLSILGNKFNTVANSQHKFAMLLRHLGTNPALGDIGDATHDNNNAFGSITGYATSQKKVMVFCTTSSPNQKIHTPTSKLNSSEITGGICLTSVINNPSYFEYACGSNSWVVPPVDITDAVDVASADVSYPEYEEVAHWMDENSLYELLSRDTLVRNSNDTLLDFYNEQEQDATKPIVEVNRFLGDMFESITGYTEADYAAMLDQAEAINNSIVSVEQYEINERNINNIYIHYLETGADDLNEDEVQTIANLAWQCPFVGGTAVYKARAMYMMYNPLAYFEDLDICNSVGIYKNNTKGLFDDENALLDSINNNNIRIINNSQLKVYPNPASDKVTIEYYNTNDTKLLVYDVTGRIIIEALLPKSNTKIDLDVRRIANGIYTFKQINSNQVINTGKFVKD